MLGSVVCDAEHVDNSNSDNAVELKRMDSETRDGRKRRVNRGRRSARPRRRPKPQVRAQDSHTRIPRTCWTSRRVEHFVNSILDSGLRSKHLECDDSVSGLGNGNGLALDGQEVVALSYLAILAKSLQF